jgi:phosphoglycolate phosphatase
MPCLVLWDVDHTLIENAGVSKEIYAAAFAILTGRSARHPAQTEGRTDPDIMAELLRSHEARSFPWRQVERALTEAGAEHRHALAERGTVLPGVSQLISSLAGTQGVAQTIVTGNIRANAEVKLAAIGLLSWLDLDIGGYGSDDRERSRLVALARKRAAAKYGAEYGDESNAVVIGDTPRDIEAARSGGARVLAVASGIHTLDELRGAGATWVMPSLADTSTVLRYVLGSPGRNAAEHAGT